MDSRWSPSKSTGWQVYVFGFFLLFSPPSWSQLFEVGPLSFAFENGTSTLTAPEPLLVSVPGCWAFIRGGTRIDRERSQVDIAMVASEADFLCIPPHDEEFSLNGLGAGTYEVRIFYGHSAGTPKEFDAQHLAGSFAITVEHSASTAYPETPTQGSVQSGIGVVRGWACNAQMIEVQFDDGERIPVAYGTSRTDTRPICGDDNNGYGAVFAWGTLGKGPHRMKTFIDSVEVGEVEFTVAGLDEPFVTGLSASYEVENFPAPGESVTLRWSEPDQNFIIVEHTE